ncbi:MAG TPA: hypothetical protein VKT33_02120 [Candidatus Angelobacter sp.]|nr:hypothetical protein [Candidatus Angelobacter sp.]
MPNIAQVARALTIRNRLFSAVFSGAKTMVVSFLRIMYVLWLQVTGVIFAALTLSASTALIKQYRMGTVATDRQRFWVTLTAAVVCGWFTLVSFVRASRTRRT